jgi:prepilin-type N-terminal cleavage/methylation domain-containing protein
MKLQSRMKARFKSATHSEQGFTLVELVVTMSIVSIIVASLAGSFIVGLKSMGSTQQRFDQSHDAQLLSMYFIPDAQSVDPGGVVTAPTAPLGCGGPGQTPPVYVPGTDVSALRLEWTDSSGIPAVAQYRVEEQPDSTFQLTRYFCVDGGTFTKVAVSHDLNDASPTWIDQTGGDPKAPNLCSGNGSIVGCEFGTTGETLALHVTTQLRDSSGNLTGSPYSFQVRGTRRNGAASSGLPRSIISQDAPAPNGPDGQVHSIVITFNGPVSCGGPCPTSGWTLGGTTSSVSAVSTSGAVVTLSVSPPVPDGQSGSLTVALAQSAGVLDLSGNPVFFGPQSVTDGVTTLLDPTHPPVSLDTDGDGKIDHIRVTFSKAISPTYTAPNSIWAVHDPNDPSVTVAPAPYIALTGTTAILSLTGATKVDTVAAGTTVSLQADPNGITDTNGNPLSFGTVSVHDGMAPVVTGMQMFDTKSDGYIDQVKVSFSEPLVANCTAPCIGGWNLTSAPSGGLLQNVTTSDSVTTLTIASFSSPQDTGATAFQVQLQAGAGIADSSGNAATFSPQHPADMAAPVLLGVTIAQRGKTPGLFEAGDQAKLQFSEPISLAQITTPFNVTLNSGSPNTFTVPGIASISTGSTGYITSGVATFQASTASLAQTKYSNDTILITLGNCAGAGCNSLATGTAAQAIVTPATTVQDLASPPNPAVSSPPVPIPSIQWF